MRAHTGEIQKTNDGSHDPPGEVGRSSETLRSGDAPSCPVAPVMCAGLWMPFLVPSFPPSRPGLAAGRWPPLSALAPLPPTVQHSCPVICFRLIPCPRDKPRGLPQTQKEAANCAQVPGKKELRARSLSCATRFYSCATRRALPTEYPQSTTAAFAPATAAAAACDAQEAALAVETGDR